MNKEKTKKDSNKQTMDNIEKFIKGLKRNVMVSCFVNQIFKLKNKKYHGKM